MKRLFFILGAILIHYAAFSQIKSFRDLQGKWEIVGEGMQNASLEIIDSVNVFLTFEGERKKADSIRLNARKNPAWFDFVVNDAATGPMHVRTLVQVYGNGVMKWQLFLDDERTNYFTSTRGEMFFLKKTPVESGAVASQE